MREYIFDEKNHVEAMINSGYVDPNNPTYTIKELSRYNHYIRGLNKTQNYDDINRYMREHCNIYTEVGYQTAINGCIRDAKKRPFADISHIVITSSELQMIRALDDDRKERIAFVLLADAKYFDACNNKKTDISWITTSDLYKLSRVTMPIKERPMFLGFLYDENLVEMNFNPKFTGKTLLYVDDSDDEVGLILTENNYKELAFTYMNWRNGGYKECEKCGRLIKIRKNARYCKDCTPKTDKIEYKTVICIDCGAEIVVSQFDTETCRCEECNLVYQRKRNAEKNRTYRERMKAKS